MSLPDKHRTARFESLPQRLKAKAEAIINKKFDIESEAIMDLKIADKMITEKLAAEGKDREGVAKKAAINEKIFLANGVDELKRIAMDSVFIDPIKDATDRINKKLIDVIDECNDRYDLKEKMEVDGWDKDDIEALAFKPRKTIVLGTDDYYARYMPSEQRYRADAECPDCYEEHVEYYTAREAVEYNAIGRVWICEDCKAELSLTIRTETFPERPEAKIRGEFKVGDICTIVDSQRPTWTGYRDGDTVTVISESNFGSYEVRRADNRYTQTLHGEQLTLKSPW